MNETKEERAARSATKAELTFNERKDRLIKLLDEELSYGRENAGSQEYDDLSWITDLVRRSKYRVEGGAS